MYIKRIVRQGGRFFFNMDDFNQAAAAEPVNDNNYASASATKDLEDYLNSWGLGMYIDQFKGT